MREEELKITETDKICRIDRYEGHDRNVVLPAAINGKPVAAVGAKAFLSCREIERLQLPETVERIEDWAFAHMKSLEELVLPAKDIILGKKVFLDCRKLKRVTLSGAGELYEGIPYFLAAMTTLLEEPSVDFRLAGSRKGQWIWLKDYDRALLQYLEREDTYGFEPAFIGWFNVEDVDDQQENFIRERRKRKIDLAFQRLLYGAELEPETEKKLSMYLLGVSRLVMEQFSDPKGAYIRDVRYFKIWQRIDGFEALSAQTLLEKLPEADPEIRAFLMECHPDDRLLDDFFAEMQL